MAVVPKQLTPFKKGISGNPKGKPKGTISITTAVKNRLREASKDGKTNLDLVIDSIMDKAVADKDHATLRTMWNYVDGMPRETKDVNVRDVTPMLDLTKKPNVRNNNSDKEDSSTGQEDKSSARRDISIEDDLDTDISDKQSAE